MSELTQDQRIALFRTPLGDNVLVLTHFEGVEGLGELFEFRIEALSEQQNLDFNPAIGQHCSIKVKTYGQERMFDGILVESQWLGMRETYHAYRLILRPWVWMLSHRANCQIFRDKSVTDIIEQIFQDAGYQDFEKRLTESYPPIEYCVQYRESDFNFVSRLMEHWGIYYFFTHEAGKHTLVLADAMSSHRDIPGHSTFPYLPVIERGQRDKELLYQWSGERRFRTGHFRLNDYDFKKPNADLVAKALGNESYTKSSYEIYDYPGKYLERGQGEKFAKILMQAEQALDYRCYASGDAISLVPGGKFTLDPRPQGVKDSQFTVVRSSHSLTTEHYRSTAGGGGEIYFGTYEFLPTSRPFRSMPLTPKTRVYGPQTAKVVGQDGEEIDVDEYGRIRLKFHWMRDQDPTQTCRVRVAQIWSGKQWGGQFIPRIGQEAVVEFLEGDPDNPLVVGTVYNEEYQFPYSLPENKTQSGWKTNSTKGGGGFNEIRFEDKKGEEELYVRAEKDKNVLVQNDRSEEVGHDESISIGNDRTESVGRNETIEIGQNKSDTIGQNLVIEAGMKIELKVGGSKIVIDNTGIQIKGAVKVDVDAVQTTVKGAAMLTLQGGMIKIN